MTHSSQRREERRTREREKDVLHEWTAEQQNVTIIRELGNWLLYVVESLCVVLCCVCMLKATWEGFEASRRGLCQRAQ